MTATGSTLGELAALCGARLQGGIPEHGVTGVAPLDEAGPAEVAFYANPSYRKLLKTTRAGAIVLSPGDAAFPELAGRALLVHASPYAAFAKISTRFHPPPRPEPGIDPRAVVDPEASVDPTARVEALAVVQAGAQVGPGAWIRSFAYVGEDARIGAGSVLWPHVVVRDRCEVGARCILHPGVVVGADGFGFAFDPEGDGSGPVHRKVPQAGIARLEDDVELGANTCVDRATLGETVVGHGSKVDNLVQLAHNVKLGPMCLLAAQTGIAGSTVVGTGVMMGGQVGVIGHVRVGDLARLGAQSGAMGDVEAGATVLGTPAIDARAWRRAALAFGRIPRMMRDLREIKRRLGIGRGEGDEG